METGNNTEEKKGDMGDGDGTRVSKEATRRQRTEDFLTDFPLGLKEVWGDLVQS